MDIKSLPKILYIDDTDESRALARHVLARDYILLEADDPLKGIELARDTQPDLVLLDIHLPNMSGIDVAIRLRSLLNPGVPIVAITSDLTSGIRERALAAGFSGFLNKPINIETFEEELRAFLGGKREHFENAEAHLRAYQSEVVERLETRVRELTDALNRNTYLSKQNKVVIKALLRRQQLLEAGARVSHEITSILNLDNLLNKTVNIICNEFGFYYSAIFLRSEQGGRLELHAGYDEAGARMLREGFSLPVDECSLPGLAVLQKKAQISLDLGSDPNRRNQYLPEAGSEMALPLVFKDEALGVLTVQSVERDAFSEEDSAALQSLADQIAIAIHNARLLRHLEAANQQIVRSKTFEAIATATGEAIHWVGNKAAPVPGSVRRLREDLLNLLAAFKVHLTAAQANGSPLTSVFENIFDEAQAAGVDLAALAGELSNMPEKRLSTRISLESMLEDLQIIESSATTILNFKEDLIGPARQRIPMPFALAEEIERITVSMGLPKGVITTEFEPGLPMVLADPRQLDQVYNNLIKNAWEALGYRSDGRIHVLLRRDPEPGFVLSCVRDNGPGIPPEALEKIWVSFYTTKGGAGGTGLGLPACMEIVRQNGGNIWVESEPGQGAAFFVRLPVAA